MRRAFHRNWIGLAACAVIFILAVGATVSRSVERALEADATARAEHWADFLTGKMPGLDYLMSFGRPTAAQSLVLEQAVKIGNVDRFNLFDPVGNLVFASDSHDRVIVWASNVVNEKPLQVARTRKPMVSLQEDTGRSDRPLVFAEAVVPVIDQKGNLTGVAEVVIDMTESAAGFRHNFTFMAFMIIAMASVVFGALAWAYMKNKRRADHSENRANFLSANDSLTGALNRPTFLQAFQTARLKAANKTCGLVFVDIDHFKSINDARGHDMGDAVLRHVATQLFRCVEEEDLVARFGGDEFAIGFVNSTPEQTNEKIERILAACRMPVTQRGTTLSTSVSIGATVSEKALALKDMLHEADVALQWVKAKGRNDCAIYDDRMGNRLRREREVKALIKEALAGGGFELHYQPCVNAERDEIQGFEALLRLKDQTGTYISPAEFIPIAEEMGVISEIGNWVLQQATSDAASWVTDVYIAVNLSPLQFESGQLVAQVQQALAASGLPPHRLELEITESLLIRDEHNIAFQLDALRELGASIAMDDFGTGFSSLSYLWKYGFDKLKIDRSFIQALESDPDKVRDIIESIVLLGKRLGMTVTVEGIETGIQRDQLIAMGCRLQQGFLHGRPSTLETIRLSRSERAAQEEANKAG
ncbi:MAG: EAL domain-containing protein [Neomegalonema sp.]|nr:EAL domain-containing protein [Neomegalonema sp.]